MTEKLERGNLKRTILNLYKGTKTLESRIVVLTFQVSDKYLGFKYNEIIPQICPLFLY